MVRSCVAGIIGSCTMMGGRSGWVMTGDRSSSHRHMWIPSAGPAETSTTDDPRFACAPT
jgi:hypothetical protein